MTEPTPPSPFACADLIREIGRGARGARSLSREDAFRLYEAILAGRVSDIELGAALMAYRIKGETAAELAGMLQAAHATLNRIAPPAGTVSVVIPSYNGARKQPNLVPLLALLLAREGVPVLIHGLTAQAGRVTTAEVLAALDIDVAQDAAAAEDDLVRRGLAFVETATLSPAMARQLHLRGPMGVRNMAHTLVKLLQPLAGPALRLVNYTHPSYRDMLTEHFNVVDPVAWPGVLLGRGTEGEAVAEATLARETRWLHGQTAEIRTHAAPRLTAEPGSLPASMDAAATAGWINAVLAGTLAVPSPIAAQVANIVDIVRTRP